MDNATRLLEHWPAFQDSNTYFVRFCVCTCWMLPVYRQHCPVDTLQTLFKSFDSMKLFEEDASNVRSESRADKRTLIVA